MSTGSQIRFLPVSGDATWMVDSQGVIVFWNEAAEELIKIDANQVIGRPCHQIITGCDVTQHLFCPCRRTEGGAGSEINHPAHFRMRTLCGDGVERVFQVITHLISNCRHCKGIFVLHTAYLAEKKINRAGLQIHLLGPVMATRPDGTPVEGTHWRRSKVRALLGVLALEAGRPVHREKLLEVLWSNLNYRAALANLNTTVYHLRRSLSPQDTKDSTHNRIEYEGDHYALRWSGRDWLDTIAFEIEIKCAREAARPEDAARHYQAALQLYRGDFIDDVILIYQDNYYLREQERFREIFLSAMEDYALLEEERQHLCAAEDLYTRILTKDPCHETACRRLMALLLRTGNRARAIAHFRQLDNAMQRELNTVPGAETVQLYYAARMDGEGESSGQLPPTSLD